ncbi:uncharacterized protein LOC119402037 isoform X2 [Rhipicephalus sanguineus]|uniref:uncharacterized protein LOC119402037 isoform X2 n=1 Tax=Rhipicephalus sanguineus TaxID=34632 RepID=UPI001894E2FA|nr:uncharacterized protein LOC119402037 isoform X2 [Rhipicephalus sanguineus]
MRTCLLFDVRSFLRIFYLLARLFTTASEKRKIVGTISLYFSGTWPPLIFYGICAWIGQFEVGEQVVPCAAYNYGNYGHYGYANNLCRGGRYTAPWNPCKYKCVTNAGHYYYNSYPDGTVCILKQRPLEIGLCEKGQCRKGVTRRPRPNSCDPPKNVPVNSQGNRHGVAGICQNGDCIAHYLLDDHGTTEAVSKIFAQEYKNCTDKEHLGKSALYDCHRYCKVGGGWYFGHYTSNSTCQFHDRNRLGWCCEGYCHEKMGCAGKNNKKIE